ncbi:MAG: hypothetical protein KC643_07060, partial [Nitrospira sp.]|nr:hypothetical protein [Nitrospira sp.]
RQIIPNSQQFFPSFGCIRSNLRALLEGWSRNLNRDHDGTKITSVKYPGGEELFNLLIFPK